MSNVARNPDDFVTSFLRPPLYSNAFARGYGTLYTAVYRPGERTVDYRWPAERWQFAFDRFDEGRRTIVWDAPPVAVAAAP